VKKLVVALAVVCCLSPLAVGAIAAKSAGITAKGLVVPLAMGRMDTGGWRGIRPDRYSLGC
jgi:hypothetical protein